jgi:hypothetical protein
VSTLHNSPALAFEVGVACLLMCLFFPSFIISYLVLSLPLTTGKFLENSSVQGRQASVGTYQDSSDNDDDSDWEDLDNDSNQEDDSNDDSNHDDNNDDNNNNNTPSSRIMVMKTKWSTPQKKLAPATSSKGKTNKIKDPAMQELIKWFNIAKIRGDGHVGFDFGATFPYMWFSPR